MYQIHVYHNHFSDNYSTLYTNNQILEVSKPHVIFSGGYFFTDAIKNYYYYFFFLFAFVKTLILVYFDFSLYDLF